MILDFKMKYYQIRHSLDKRILGHYPQQKDTIFHCSIDDEPRFVEHVYSTKIDYKPIIANAVLHSKSVPTDLISAFGLGFSHKLLISGKLRSTLENSRDTGLQFFHAPIIHKNQELEDYWIMNLYEVNMEFIDFSKSEVFVTERGFDYVEKLQLNSIEEFRHKKQEIANLGYPMGIRIPRYKIKDGIDQHFFMLTDVDGGVNYIVSETLKTEIEHAGCTGIEFMPSELLLNEWLHDGERVRIYGKT